MKIHFYVVVFMWAIFNFSQNVQAQTTLNLGASKDSYVRDDAATTNYGTQAYIQVQYTAAAKIWRGLIEFDFSSIPKGAFIESATLDLYKVNGAWNLSLLIQQNTNSWTETGVTWNSKPNVNTTDELTFSTGTGGVASGHLTYDVTSHVAAMTCYHPNFGWTIRYTSESSGAGKYINYRSKEHTTPSERPKLTIVYYDPISITADVIHSSTASSTDGSVDVTVSGGKSAYTYSWTGPGGFTSSSQDISSLNPGVYQLHISDANSQNYYAYVLVGNYSSETTFTLQPDANYGWDANIIGGSTSYDDNNYGTNTEFKDGYASSLITKGLIKFNYFGLSDITKVRSANLILEGKAHTGASNSSELKRITSSWCEQCVTHNTAPTTVTTDMMILANSGSSTEDYTIDVLPFVNFHKDDPTNINYGYQLNLVSLTNNNALVFYSSDDGTAGNRPKLEIKMTCIKVQYEPKKIADAGYCDLQDKVLYFVYDEEYNVESGQKLRYRIYNDVHERVAEVDETGTATPGSAPNPTLTYGKNAFAFNLTALALPTGRYLLEIINSKKEKLYLRFKI